MPSAARRTTLVSYPKPRVKLPVRTFGNSRASQPNHARIPIALRFGRPKRKAIGMRAWLGWLAREFPNVRTGNFTRGFG